MSPSDSADTTFGIAAIDRAIDLLAENETFTLDELVAALGARDGGDDELRRRLERLLDGDERFFNANDRFTTRASFFRGLVFAVTPTALEIAEGMLIPGHRWSTFISPEVFPSEATLRCGTENFALKTFKGPLQEIFSYHLLLGSEQIFDFLMADRQENAFLRRSAGAGAEVTVSVFDMADFYREHDFAEGDAILCKVTDWERGEIACEYLSGAGRGEHQCRVWVDQFNEALGRVLDRFRNYLELPDQLRWAFFLGGKEKLGGREAASLDEFIRNEVPFEISCEPGYTVFVRAGADEALEDSHEPHGHDGDACDCGDDHHHHEHEQDIPDGFSVSSGATDSLDAILEDIGSHVSPGEIDAYILDGCFYREEDFDGFYGRCFGEGKLHFSDEAQELVFKNFLEERFERVRESYDRAVDEPRAPIRESMLEAIDRRLELFDLLENVGADPAKLPQDAFKTLRDVRGHFGRILMLLNDLTRELGPEEADSLAGVVEQLADRQDEAAEKLETAVADL